MSHRASLTTFFGLAYGISWTVWTPLWAPSFGVVASPVIPFHRALGASGPIAAAFLVSWLEAGPAGPGDLLRRMVLFRRRLVWLAVALIGPYALLALAVAAAVVRGGESVSLAGVARSREFPQLSPLGFLAFNVVTFGYGEEVGWRGFVLPRTSRRNTSLMQPAR